MPDSTANIELCLFAPYNAKEVAASSQAGTNGSVATHGQRRRRLVAHHLTPRRRRAFLQIRRQIQKLFRQRTSGSEVLRPLHGLATIHQRTSRNARISLSKMANASGSIIAGGTMTSRCPPMTNSSSTNSTSAISPAAWATKPPRASKAVSAASSKNSTTSKTSASTPSNSCPSRNSPENPGATTSAPSLPSKTATAHPPNSANSSTNKPRPRHARHHRRAVCKSTPTPTAPSPKSIIANSGSTKTTPTCGKHAPGARNSNYTLCISMRSSNSSPPRKYVIESIAYWIEHFHVDGIRFDVPPAAISDFNIVREFTDAAFKKIDHRKPFFTVAEHIPEDPAIVGYPNAGPMIAAWHDSFANQLQAVATRHEHYGSATLRPRHARTKNESRHQWLWYGQSHRQLYRQSPRSGTHPQADRR